MMGKKLVTHQTGPEGKEVKRLYIEEASDISKEFYLSCLIDRESSKIAFISSTEGGMDIEKVAAETPDKIKTNKIELKKEGLNEKEIDNILVYCPFEHIRTFRKSVWGLDDLGKLWKWLWKVEHRPHHPSVKIALR